MKKILVLILLFKIIDFAFAGGSGEKSHFVMNLDDNQITVESKSNKIIASVSKKGNKKESISICPVQLNSDNIIVYANEKFIWIYQPESKKLLKYKIGEIVKDKVTLDKSQLNSDNLDAISAVVNDKNDIYYFTNNSVKYVKEEELKTGSMNGESIVENVNGQLKNFIIIDKNTIDLIVGGIGDENEIFLKNKIIPSDKDIDVEIIIDSIKRHTELVSVLRPEMSKGQWGKTTNEQNIRMDIRKKIDSFNNSNKEFRERWGINIKFENNTPPDWIKNIKENRVSSANKYYDYKNSLLYKYSADLELILNEQKYKELYTEENGKMLSALINKQINSIITEDIYRNIKVNFENESKVLENDNKKTRTDIKSIMDDCFLLDDKDKDVYKINHVRNIEILKLDDGRKAVFIDIPNTHADTNDLEARYKKINEMRIKNDDVKTMIIFDKYLFFINKELIIINFISGDIYTDEKFERLFEKAIGFIEKDGKYYLLSNTDDGKNFIKSEIIKNKNNSYLDFKNIENKPFK